jgi:hypothetical protein
MRLQWGIHQEAQRTSCLEYRAVACVLREKRPLRFAAGPETYAGASAVGKETNVHSGDITPLWLGIINMGAAPLFFEQFVKSGTIFYIHRIPFDRNVLASRMRTFLTAPCMSDSCLTRAARTRPFSSLRCGECWQALAGA